MTTAAIARIVACTIAHLNAIAKAAALGEWPALVIEDDVTFELLRATGVSDAASESPELSQAVAYANDARTKSKGQHR